MPRADEEAQERGSSQRSGLFTFITGDVRLEVCIRAESKEGAVSRWRWVQKWIERDGDGFMVVHTPPDSGVESVIVRML